MNRIFAVVATFANAALLLTFWLGWSIDDAGSLDEADRVVFSWHFLTAIGVTILVMLVHAIVLTWFMGTGRWIEETSEAYRMPPDLREKNIRLKYRVIPGMVTCFILVIATGSLGAIADPASHVSLDGAATIHMWLALVTITGNIIVSYIEYAVVRENQTIVDAVWTNVQTAKASIQPTVEQPDHSNDKAVSVS